MWARAPVNTAIQSRTGRSGSVLNKSKIDPKQEPFHRKQKCPHFLGSRQSVTANF
jgi:hypothetical protein